MWLMGLQRCSVYFYSLNVKDGKRVFLGYQSPRCQMKREILNKCLVFRDGGQ